MTGSEELQATAAFYDATAARYDSEIDGSDKNLKLRDEFCRRVSAMAGEGGTILDFGCGTGTDASWYAERGHRTLAYDISAGMVDILQRRCAREIAEGTVRPVVGELSRLESELAGFDSLSAVAANFAVLNHVRDLRPLFRLFASHLAPRGVVVASLINPFHWRDMRRGWWWMHAVRSFGSGAIRFSGDVTTYRHFVRTVEEMAAPSMVLAEREPLGLSSRNDRSSRSRWRGTFSASFLMLVLRSRE
jgi:SAM-dependent methyltransferase